MLLTNDHNSYEYMTKIRNEESVYCFFLVRQISDFGLAVISGNHSKGNLKLSGTMGYVAPEYLLDGICALFFSCPCVSLVILFVEV